MYDMFSHNQWICAEVEWELISIRPKYTNQFKNIIIILRENTILPIF